MNLKEAFTSLVVILLQRLPGLHLSGSLLVEKIRKLEAENISLKLENKILRGQIEIDKRIDSMSSDELRKLVEGAGDSGHKQGSS